MSIDILSRLAKFEDTEESARSSCDTKIKCIGFPGNFHIHDCFELCERKVAKLEISIFN